MMSPAVTILVVDDSPVCRTVLRVALRRVGYHVLTCSDSLHALELLTRPDLPLSALLVLDWILPRLSGLDLILLLRRQTRYPQLKRLPILMLSCRSAPLDRLKARLAGASAFLPKPLTVADLLTTVSRLLAQSCPVPPPPSSSAPPSFPLPP
jgi:twitching motility two-component system response regulator PilG